MTALRSLLAVAAAALIVAAAPAPAEARVVCQRSTTATAVATIDVWGSTSCATGREVARIAYAADWPDHVTVRVRGRRVRFTADVLAVTSRRFEVVYFALVGTRTLNVRVLARTR